MTEAALTGGAVTTHIEVLVLHNVDRDAGLGLNMTIDTSAVKRQCKPDERHELVPVFSYEADTLVTDLLLDDAFRMFNSSATRSIRSAMPRPASSAWG